MYVYSYVSKYKNTENILTVVHLNQIYTYIPYFVLLYADVLYYMCIVCTVCMYVCSSMVYTYVHTSA